MYIFWHVILPFPPTAPMATGTDSCQTPLDPPQIEGLSISTELDAAAAGSPSVIDHDAGKVEGAGWPCSVPSAADAVTIDCEASGVDKENGKVQAACT